MLRSFSWITAPTQKSGMFTDALRSTSLWIRNRPVAVAAELLHWVLLAARVGAAVPEEEEEQALQVQVVAQVVEEEQVHPVQLPPQVDVEQGLRLLQELAEHPLSLELLLQQVRQQLPVAAEADKPAVVAVHKPVAAVAAPRLVAAVVAVDRV